MQDLRILIVGAGIGGLTCAGLLARQGAACVVVERVSEAEFNRGGYVLGLLPLGGRVLNALDARAAYHDASIAMRHYAVHDADGRLIRDYPLERIGRDYGDYRGIERAALIDLLRNSAGDADLRFATTVDALAARSGGVEVRLSDGSVERFDLVIGADGLHSRVRELGSFGATAWRDTGWGGWMTWLPGAPEPVYREFWGAGTFLGLYPVAGRTGVFLGGPVTASDPRTFARLHDAVAARVPAESPAALALAAFDDDRAADFFWHFHDCRSPRWRSGRVLLLGDAAAAFLPTAGVGASMAMDSAAALVDELSRADPTHIEYALRLYERRQRPRVEKAQADSRKLGRLMFLRSGLLAGLRNRLLGYYSLERMLSELSRVMEGR